MGLVLLQKLACCGQIVVAGGDRQVRDQAVRLQRLSSGMITQDTPDHVYSVGDFGNGRKLSSISSLSDKG